MSAALEAGLRPALILPIALRRHAEATPEAPAVREPGRTWTYAALDAHADALAGGLVAAGVRAGDRVALLAAPSATAIALLAAAGRVGACIAPLGTRLTTPEVAAAGIEIKPRIVVHDDAHARLAMALGVPAMRVDSLAGTPSLARSPSSAGDPPQNPTTPAVAVLTSGTTGRPKAAVLSHAAMAASAAAWSAALPEATGWLLCLGLAHVAGLGVAWRAIGAGVPLWVLPAFDADAVLDVLRGGPTSHVSLVPTQLARLLDAVDAAGGVEHASLGEHAPRHRPAGAGDLRGVAESNLRAVLLGGAPVPPGLVTRALAAGWPVVPTYGLTEACSGVTALATADAPARPGSAGRPLPGVELRIASADTDGAGEIHVRTPAAFSGYLGRPDAMAATLGPDGWLRTGDVGRLDTDGFLEVLDRRDDVLVSGGESVYPAEVEAAIEEHPAVAEAGVVARPDPTWGAVPIAAVVLRLGESAPTTTELRAFCLARLAAYKVPAAFRAVASLPRTGSGKLRRAELRAILELGERGARASGSSRRTLERGGGVDLAYRVFGAAHGAEAGVPIVLLHATLSASSQLVSLARLLAVRGPVYSLSRRGSSESPLRPPERLDVAVHVADVAALLDADGIPAAIFVGHSFGGVVALEAAARMPARVRAVVAWEPPYGPLADAPTRVAFAAVAAATEQAHAGSGSAAAAAAFLDGVAGVGSWDALSDRARAFLAAQGDGACADAALAGLDPAGLSRISVPVTILTGTASEPFYAPIARALVERVPASRLVVLDGLRHAAPITDPEPVASAILDALAVVGVPASLEAQR